MAIDGRLVELTFRTDRTGIPVSQIEEALLVGVDGAVDALLPVVIDPPLPLQGRYVLGQNNPNPFNPSTAISYQLPEDSNVSLTVYNLQGQAVRTLARAQQSPGAYMVTWDGRDDADREVASGIYLYRFGSKGLVQTKRMLLMK